MKKLLILGTLVFLYFYFVDKEGFIPRMQQIYEFIMDFFRDKFSG
jgi:hypothetical protein